VLDRSNPPSQRTSLKLPAPSASSGFPSPFSRPLRSVGEACLPSPKSRPQGLATLSTVSAPKIREGLFQPPTLLGFPLQSLPPLPWSSPGFPKPHPSCPCGKNPPAFPGGFRDFLPPKKPSPFCAPRRINPGRDPVLSWGFAPPRSSPDPVEEKSLSLFSFPSRPSSQNAFQRLVPQASGFSVRNRLASPPVGGADLPGVSHRRPDPTS
jgi:hypothetical protein